MDLYHSRLTQDDLNDPIIKYKIPRDLHHRLPSEEFVMSELPNDAIGIYHRMFDFSSVRIPFSSFFLALIKHYKVHFSQLGPLGLNKVITIEVLCRSLQIEPTVTLFRVLQTLCKQGDWFSFAKRRASSPVCIDDNHAAIDDPRPAAGSFSMADVRRLSEHVIKLRDMPEGVLVLSGLSRVWKSRVCDPVLRGADGNGMGMGFDYILSGLVMTKEVMTKEVFKDPAVCKTVVDQFPTPREMVRVESLSDDQLTAKMSVLHCMMMSHGGEILARYLSTLKKQVSRINDKLYSSDASFAKSKAKGKERKKKIKSLTKSVDNLQNKVARFSAALNQATVLEAEEDEEILRLKAIPLEVQGELLSLVASAAFKRGLSMHRTKDEFAAISEHATEPLSVILQLEPEKLARPTNVPPSRDARVSPPTIKESTVTHASKSLELSTNADLTPSVVAFEHNEDMDAVELVEVGSRRASSGPNDVVVALFAGEKGDGLVPFSVAGEEAAVNPSRV
ncbi:hypothetical protein Tco_1305801 [Tanacetum coccineum]